VVPQINTCAIFSFDWFTGNFAGKTHIQWENLWFPVKIFPSTNPWIFVQTQKKLAVGILVTQPVSPD